MQRRWLGIGLAVSAVAFGGCAMDTSPDGLDEVGVIPGGKADGSDYTDCELGAVVSWLNEGTSVAALIDAGVHTRAARNLVAHRDGADATFGTADDDLFDDIHEVDAVSYVGPVAIQELVDAVDARCATGRTQVIFSPQPYASSHLAKVVQLIDGAHRSLDIAMYSFSDANIMDALERAVGRGVSIRMIYDGASVDHTSPSGTTSARLEEMGIEVRWVNKVMHHKFMIVDGVRESLDGAAESIVVTGSANWSNSAATRYDENTVIVYGNAEVSARYQSEFEHLWANSRDVVWNEDIQHIDAFTVPLDQVADDASVDALFTSANFRTYVSSRYGATFSTIAGRNTVADRWVELIRGAQHSIRIASGHLRSRPVAEALMAAHAANPDLDIRIYLDDQEYLAESTNADQERDLDACLEAAGDSLSRQQDCIDNGFLFSYVVQAAGIPLRYKFYAYRWDYHYAEQMHDKLMIIDDSIVVTGSYNLSDNAEHGTMENVLIFQGDAHRALIDAFIARFEEMWVTGEAEGLYDTLLADVRDGSGAVPIVFEPMSLSWAQVTELKRAIRSACPAVDTQPYRDHPEAHHTCTP